MKTTINLRFPGLLLAGITLAGFASCADDDDKKNNPELPEPEVLVEGVVVSWNGTSADDVFSAPAFIGLYAVEGGFTASAPRYIDNSPMELHDGVFKTASESTLRRTEGTLVAYYPYRGQLLAASELTAEVGIPANQAVAENYAAADFMVATAVVEAGHSGPVRMAFGRMCSKIDLEVTPSGSPTLDELKNASFSLELQGAAEVDFVARKVISTSNPGVFGMYGSPVAETGKLSGLSVVVVPQTIAADAPVLHIRLAETDIASALGREVVLKSGMQYKLSVTAGRTAGDFEVSVEVTEQEWLDGLNIEQALEPEDDLLKPVTDGEGNSYPVVKIGTQYWMAANLRTTRLNDGASLTQIREAALWEANGEAQQPAYCYQDNQKDYAEEFGAIYNFYAVATNKLCPAGWHVPSKDEIAMMIDLLGGREAAGDKLKSTSGWQAFNGKEDEAYQGTNESGFDGRPGGSRESDGTFFNFHKYGYWWSSTPVNDTQANGFYLYYSKPWAYPTAPQKRTGYSVRCIRYKN